MASDDGALEETKGRLALTAEKKVGRDFISVATHEFDVLIK
jgi:hypothetical protein